MTIESNDAIAIATLSDWLKTLAPTFQPMRSNTKTNGACTRDFFPHFEGSLQVISRNSDWFMALFALAVIGRSNYFGVGFSTVIEI